MEEELVVGYGARLEKLRLHLGLSKVEFAQKAGISQQSMSLILKEETKNPGFDVFAKLARSTQANLYWLAYGEGEMTRMVETLKDEQGFGQMVIDQLQSRVSELKEMLENQRYIISLQRTLLEGQQVLQGKWEGDTVRPLYPNGIPSTKKKRVRGK